MLGLRSPMMVDAVVVSAHPHPLHASTVCRDRLRAGLALLLRETDRSARCDRVLRNRRSCDGENPRIAGRWSRSAVGACEAGAMEDQLRQMAVAIDMLHRRLAGAEQAAQNAYAARGEMMVRIAQMEASVREQSVQHRLRAQLLRRAQGVGRHGLPVLRVHGSRQRRCRCTTSMVSGADRGAPRNPRGDSHMSERRTLRLVGADPSRQ